MEFPRALDRSRPAPSERGDQSCGTRKCQSCPYAKSGGQEQDQRKDKEGSIDPELGHDETTMFRAVAARLNYLSPDRPDITLATMKLCSKKSRLDAQDLKKMKRVGRFLVGKPRVGCLFEWQAHPGTLHALADADWARDRLSRKSVSGEHDLAREAPDQGLNEAAKHCGHQQRRSRTVRWQPCSNSIDGSSGVCQRLG